MTRCLPTLVFVLRSLDGTFFLLLRALRSPSVYLYRYLMGRPSRRRASSLASRARQVAPGPQQS